VVVSKKKVIWLPLGFCYGVHRKRGETLTTHASVYNNGVKVTGRKEEGETKNKTS